MKTTTTLSDATLDTLAEAVADFALIAFRPEHYDGCPDSAASFAAFAWNAFDPRAHVVSTACLMPDKRLRVLYRAMRKARRHDFGRFEAEVWELDARPQPHALFFVMTLGRPGEDGGATRRVRVPAERVPRGVLPARA